MKTTYLSLLIFFLTTYSSTAQHLNVSGRVIGEDLEGFPGVSIYDEDTTLLTTSNLDGTFELSNSPTKLIFATVGAEWDNISVSDSCSRLEVILLLASTYHYKSHRKIDRLRKEQFDNRVELHKRAFEQGVFENDSPCFDFTFLPNKPELDEIRTWMNEKKVEIREEFEQLSAGDTVYIPYSGTSTNSVHSGYSNYVDYECLIEGVVISKNKKQKGFNIFYRVTDLDSCNYETLTHNDDVVNVGDTIQYNMRHFRLITASNKRYE
jgi:hypothetical protein